MKADRRTFIKNSLASAAGVSLFNVLPVKAFGTGFAPSDKINVALIGCRNKGFGILKNHLEYQDAQCVALCDVDDNVLQEKAADIRENHGMKPKLYSDFRKMLEQKDIDAVIVGTPDHWHCLNTIYSLQAGKHVYVEKPMANTIGECTLMMQAADRYGKKVQVGQQQRSNPMFIQTKELVQSGKIGKLRKVNIWANFNYGLGPEALADTPVPGGVDYEMWLGPAPKRPYNKNRFHGSWRHFWDYGGGLMSDWGVHLLDMPLWVNDIQEAPEKVLVYAENTFPEERPKETFDSMSIIFPRRDFLINWDMTAGVQQGPYGKLYGVAFVGDNGTIVTTRGSIQLFPEWDDKSKKHKAEPIDIQEGQEAHTRHVRNFLDCIKSGDEVACPPKAGWAAALHAHIPNIAGRVKENMLIFDQKTMTFTNCKEANNYITPEYRKPWELPKI